MGDDALNRLLSWEERLPRPASYTPLDIYEMGHLLRVDAVLLVAPEATGDSLRAVLRRPTRDGGDSSVARFPASDSVARSIVAWAMRDSLFPVPASRTRRSKPQ